VEFWVKRLGWKQAVAVPEGDKLGFVILAKDTAEVMYQTWASVEKDLGKPAARSKQPSVGLFLEVSDLAAIEKQIKGLPKALERRKTFYGMEEVGVLEPGGHMVVFAQPVKS
jgi:hypothetical protein